MQTEQKGVLIKAIEPTSNAASHLKKGDILLSFDGTVIANDGTVPFRSGPFQLPFRLPFLPTKPVIWLGASLL